MFICYFIYTNTDDTVIMGYPLYYHALTICFLSIKTYTSFQITPVHDHFSLKCVITYVNKCDDEVNLLQKKTNKHKGLYMLEISKTFTFLLKLTLFHPFLSRDIPTIF